MSGVREGLELTHINRLAKCGRFPKQIRERAIQEPFLRNELLGGQAGCLTGPLGQAEIGMGSDVLFSGVSQHIVDTFLVAVTAHCSVRLIRSRPVVRAVAVIECNQPALGQALGRFAPPSGRCGRKFGAVLIRQYIEQLAWPSGEQHAPSGVRRIHPSPTKRIVTPRHTPLKPVALGLAPADSVHREGIEQFVAENDTSNLRQSGDRIDPLDFLFKLGQTLGLPAPPPVRWLHDVVRQRLHQRLIVFG